MVRQCSGKMARQDAPKTPCKPELDTEHAQGCQALASIPGQNMKERERERLKQRR